jgi:ribonuclease Z
VLTANRKELKMNRFSRFAVSAAALGFAALAVGCWIAPQDTALRFGLEALGAVGNSSIRADLGGLFAGLALLCGFGLKVERRSWLAAAALVMVGIVFGRLLGWVVDGRAGAALPQLAVEIAVLLALGSAARMPPPGRVQPSRSRWRWAPVAVVALVLAGAAAVLASTEVQQGIFDQAAEKLTSAPNTALLQDDALRVAICGSSAPLPSADRAKSCVAVFAGGKYYVVDSGPESTENLVLWGIPLSRIEGVLLTHFHSDHIGDLGELNLQTWAGGRREPLRVYGGPGVEEVVAGFNQVYRLDQGYRTEHHGEKVMPSAAHAMVARVVELDGPATPAKDRTALVLEEGELRITAIEVDHAPIAPAYAYRFDYKGRSVVVTGDLKDHPPLAKAAAGADVLVSEAIAVQMTRSLSNAAREAGRDDTAAIMHDIEDYHITPEQAARIANEAGVKLLVYYHLLPAPDGLIPRRLFADGVDAVRQGDWTIADDGSLYTLPLGSDRVAVGHVGR